MKKIIAFVFLFSLLPASAFDLPTVPVNELSPMHDMQSMQIQKFRQEQLDYYNDVKTEKEKFKKRNTKPTEELQEKIQEAVQRANTRNSKSQFVRGENGQIIIKYGE